MLKSVTSSVNVGVVVSAFSVVIVHTVGSLGWGAVAPLLFPVVEDVVVFEAPFPFIF